MMFFLYAVVQVQVEKIHKNEALITFVYDILGNMLWKCKVVRIPFVTFFCHFGLHKPSYDMWKEKKDTALPSQSTRKF